ncbi:MAG: restriction endonuclease [Beijerinckiaceae bacterium]
METVRIWAIRAGSAGQADDLFLAQSHIAISSAAIDDDIGGLPPVRGAFKELLAQCGEYGSPATLPLQAGQMYRFVHEVRIGDRVIFPRKCDRTVHWGRVTGPYLFDCEGPPGFAHRRPVQWIAHCGRDDFSPGALFELGSTASLFRVREFALEFLKQFEPQDAYEVLRNCEHLEDIPDLAQRDIVEATNDFIANRLKTDLKGIRLEPFVAELFRAMGYRTRTTRPVKDDGVDVIAHRDELGIEPPIIKIQVKSGHTNVNADSVKAFYAMVDEREVGIVISMANYTQPAREFARTKSNLKLMTGVDLIELITKYYDDLELNFRQLIPMRRVLVPETMVTLRQ